MILYAKLLKNKVIGPNGDDIYALAVHPGAVSFPPSPPLARPQVPPADPPVNPPSLG